MRVTSLQLLKSRAEARSSAPAAAPQNVPEQPDPRITETGKRSVEEGEAESAKKRQEVGEEADKTLKNESETKVGTQPNPSPSLPQCPKNHPDLEELEEERVCENPQCWERCKRVVKGANGLRLCLNCYSHARYHHGGLRNREEVEKSHIRSKVLGGTLVCTVCHTSEGKHWQVDYENKGVLCFNCGNQKWLGRRKLEECENPACADKEPYLTKTEVNSLGSLKLCKKCYEWARNHGGALRNDQQVGRSQRRKKKDLLKKCENPACDEHEQYLKRGPHDLKVCNKCRLWARSHDGELRSAEEVERSHTRRHLLAKGHVCGNEDCRATESRRWAIDYIRRRFLCDKCIRKEKVGRTEQRTEPEKVVVQEVSADTPQSTCENDNCRDSPVRNGRRCKINSKFYCDPCYRYANTHNGEERPQSLAHKAGIRKRLLNQPKVCGYCGTLKTSQWRVDPHLASYSCENCYRRQIRRARRARV